MFITRLSAVLFLLYYCIPFIAGLPDPHIHCHPGLRPTPGDCERAVGQLPHNNHQTTGTAHSLLNFRSGDCAVIITPFENGGAHPQPMGAIMWRLARDSLVSVLRKCFDGGAVHSAGIATMTGMHEGLETKHVLILAKVSTNGQGETVLWGSNIGLPFSALLGADPRRASSWEEAPVQAAPAMAAPAMVASAMAAPGRGAPGQVTFEGVAPEMATPGRAALMRGASRNRKANPSRAPHD